MCANVLYSARTNGQGLRRQHGHDDVTGSRDSTSGQELRHVRGAPTEGTSAAGHLATQRHGNRPRLVDHLATVTEQYDGWYTGASWVVCHNWYMSTTPSALLTVPYV